MGPTTFLKLSENLETSNNLGWLKKLLESFTQTFLMSVSSETKRTASAIYGHCRYGFLAIELGLKDNGYIVEAADMEDSIYHIIYQCQLYKWILIV